MANMRKASSMKDIGHLDMHYKRGVPKGHYSNPDINQERLDEDRQNFAPTRYQRDTKGNLILDSGGRPIEQKMTDYIKSTIDKIMDGKTLRKDAVKMISWVVDAPKNMSEEIKPRFFQATYDFLAKRYGDKSGLGEDVVLSCYWHKSETTDHIHFAFMPIIERPDGTKSFCAKEVVGRSELKSFHEDLEKHLVSLGICNKGDIKNGKTQRDSYGRALSVKELKMRDKKRERDTQTHSEKKSRWDSNNLERTTDRKKGRW